MIDLNYKVKLGEIEKLLCTYQKRYLSLKGKITVIKTLAIPKIIHLLTVLPSPPKTYIEKLESVFKKFIWNNKKSRINYNQICQNIEDGGLKMTHVKTLIQALKISWIKRLIEGKGGWQDLFASVICEDIELIWELDIESLGVLSNRISNQFWKEVFLSWKAYREGKDTHICDCMYYPIWNSSFCTVKGIQCLKSELQNSGLNYVKDLMDNNGRVLGYLDFKNKFNVNVNFVDFYSLMHCIKREWKGVHTTCNEINGRVKQLINKIINTKVCKYVYSDILQNVKYASNSQAKWTELGFKIDNDEWKDIYRLPVKVTTESKLQSFQYQVVKRSLVTNKSLYLWKIKESDCCQFCKRHVETIEHLFFECNVVKHFWSDVSRWLPPELKFGVFVSRKNVLLGDTRYEGSLLLNHLCILIKRYIYVSKCLDRQLNIISFVRMLRNCYMVEKNIAVANDNIKGFECKWNKMHSIMEPL